MYVSSQPKCCIRSGSALPMRQMWLPFSSANECDPAVAASRGAADNLVIAGKKIAKTAVANSAKRIGEACLREGRRWAGQIRHGRSTLPDSNLTNLVTVRTRTGDRLLARSEEPADRLNLHFPMQAIPAPQFSGKGNPPTPELVSLYLIASCDRFCTLVGPTGNTSRTCNERFGVATLCRLAACKMSASGQSSWLYRVSNLVK